MLGIPQTYTATNKMSRDKMVPGQIRPQPLSAKERHSRESDAGHVRRTVPTPYLPSDIILQQLKCLAHPWRKRHRELFPCGPRGELLRRYLDSVVPSNGVAYVSRSEKTAKSRHFVVFIESLSVVMMRAQRESRDETTKKGPEGEGLTSVKASIASNL